MSGTQDFILDPSSSSVLAICTHCGARELGLTESQASRLIATHVQAAHADAPMVADRLKHWRSRHGY